MSLYTNSPTVSSRSSLTEPLLLSYEDPLAPRDHGETVPSNHYDENNNENNSKPEASSNVRRIFGLTWFSFTGRSIWSQSVLSIFIFLLCPKHLDRVGYATAILGFSQVITSLLAGCMSQSLKRDHLLKMGSVAGSGAVSLTGYSIYIQNFWFLLGALSLWGVLWGFTDAALPTLFADSIPAECQMAYYKRGSRLIRLSNVLGPMIAAGIFVYLGNEWNISNCSQVIITGLGFCVPALILLCSLNDPPGDDEINLPDEIHVPESREWSQKNPCPRNNSICEAGSYEAVDQVPMEDSFENETENRCCFCDQRFIVPLFLTVTDVLSGVASGMSIRYFPVFFVSIVGLSPVHLQILCMITPLGQAAFKCFATGLASYIGPSLVLVAFNWMFVVLLGSMIYCYQEAISVLVVCVLYLIHTSLMNSTCGLSRCIMLSTISEEEMQKWNMAETVQLLLWSAGAAAGGVLVGHFSILYNFYVTAFLQVVASVPLLVLCCVGPSKENLIVILFSSDPDDEVNGGSPVMNENEDQRMGEFSDAHCIDEESDNTEFFECCAMPA